MGKKKISVRANNIISERIKVNDLRGNPIEMAAQVVWRVTDTAQALFDVDDYKAFVMVQIEAAVRTIGSRYPYDDFEHQEVTLRGNHDQVGGELRTELIARLLSPGSPSTNAASPTSPMRRKSPARCCAASRPQAVVAARKTLVEGAVGMVEMALAQLSDKNVVELDDERRAAMVSNLMVVLCGERDTQPVVNAGTLYHRAGDGGSPEEGVSAAPRSRAVRRDRALRRGRPAQRQRADRVPAARGAGAGAASKCRRRAGQARAPAEERGERVTARGPAPREAVAAPEAQHRGWLDNRRGQSMKFGVFDHVDDSGLPLAEHLEARLRMAEAYDAARLLRLPRGRAPRDPARLDPSPALLFAAPSQRTRRLRLGPLVYLLPRYDPLRLVDEFAMLDALSNGRLELGIGRGLSPIELGFYGLDMAEQRGRYDETLEVLLKGLSSETLDHHGGILPGSTRCPWSCVRCSGRIRRCGTARAVRN